MTPMTGPPRQEPPEDYCCPPLMRLRTQWEGRNTLVDSRLTALDALPEAIKDAVQPLHEEIVGVNRRLNALMMWVLGVLGSFVVALIIVLLQHFAGSST